jgi:hypothetical protein
MLSTCSERAAGIPFEQNLQLEQTGTVGMTIEVVEVVEVGNTVSTLIQKALQSFPQMPLLEMNTYGPRLRKQHQAGFADEAEELSELVGKNLRDNMEM